MDDAASPTAWQAMARAPFRLLADRWTWRSLAYLLTAWPVALVWVCATVIALGIGLSLSLLVVGLPLLLLVPLAGIPLGVVERRRLALVDGREAIPPHRPRVPGTRRQRLAARYREAATWRELAYGVLLAPLSVAQLLVAAVLLCTPPFLVGMPWWVDLAAESGAVVGLGGPVDDPALAWAIAVLGLAVTAVLPYLAIAVAAGWGRLARALLVAAPAVTEDPARVLELTRSRARLVDAFETERRRIERDLHDGAQQQLTQVVLTLGLARAEGADRRGELVERAYGEARQALADLRDLVRGIHPSVLTDRGLEPALAAAAERCPIPVRVEVRLRTRLPASLESTVYFVVCEALTNSARHSRAERVEVVVERSGTSGPTGEPAVLVRVTDDGVGAAVAVRGGGLEGLADRVDAVGGRLTLRSPAGGPTEIEAVIPCDS
ncbi:MAG: sensor histidine kinase [Phycicoccus sp.]